jgi:hypothetical protein
MEIRNSKELEAAILHLENIKEVQKELLVAHFHETYEHFKPINLIKNTFNQIDFSPASVGDTLVNAAISTGAGLLTKKLFIGRSNNIFKKLLGLAVELGVANIVAKKSDDIKETGIKFFKSFLRHKKEEDEPAL